MYMSVYMLVVFSEYFKMYKHISVPVHELYYSQQQSSVKCNSKEAAICSKNNETICFLYCYCVCLTLH